MCFKALSVAAIVVASIIDVSFGVAGNKWITKCPAPCKFGKDCVENCLMDGVKVDEDSGIKYCKTGNFLEDKKRGCQIGYFHVDSSLECEKCGDIFEGCLSCDDSYGCTQCGDGYVLYNGDKDSKRPMDFGEACEGQCYSFCKPANTPCPTPKPATSSPSPQPTFYPTEKPSPSPTWKPTASPTKSPTNDPSVSPTWSPTKSPTISPTKIPTPSPTWQPTNKPTWPPTNKPTNNPSASPTLPPSRSPTTSPTWSPTKSPTNKPTPSPTWTPTTKPTTSPTLTPTNDPTISPTWSPTKSPTTSPTPSPTWYPTSKPTWPPTNNPTPSPTWNPTPKPTQSPSDPPTKIPTEQPTYNPTEKPTLNPSKSPTNSPTNDPTWSPSPSPTRSPSLSPTWSPTKLPTFLPTLDPTMSPTKSPSLSPTSAPTACIRDLEIVFLIDESTSITNDNWNKMMDFTSNVIDSTDEETTKISILTFGGDNRKEQTKLHYSFSDEQNRYSIINNVIPQIKTEQRKGSTPTLSGVKAAIEEFKNNGNDKIPDLLFLITDGEPSSAHQDVCKINDENNEPPSGTSGVLVDELQNDDYFQDISVEIVGIGPEITGDNIKYIQCLVDDENSIQQVNSFSNLDKILKKVTDHLCQEYGGGEYRPPQKEYTSKYPTTTTTTKSPYNSYQSTTTTITETPYVPETTSEYPPSSSSTTTKTPYASSTTTSEKPYEVETTSSPVTEYPQPPSSTTTTTTEKPYPYSSTTSTTSTTTNKPYYGNKIETTESLVYGSNECIEDILIIKFMSSTCYDDNAVTTLTSLVNGDYVLNCECSKDDNVCDCFDQVKSEPIFYHEESFNRKIGFIQDNSFYGKKNENILQISINDGSSSTIILDYDGDLGKVQGLTKWSFNANSDFCQNESVELNLDFQDCPDYGLNCNGHNDPFNCGTGGYEF